MSDKNYTCPNCGEKIRIDQFENHLRKCPRKGDREFPKYLMIMNRGHEGKKFVTMGQAGPLFDSGSMQVDIGEMVLEDDFSVRPITKSEEFLISDLAEAHSCSK